MTKDIWVTSDTHYNHAGIINFVDYHGQRVRDFDTVDQMNDCLIESWNSVVKPGDRVYHCGDVFFGDREKFEKDWPKFNGSKRLLLGNHDDGKYLAKGGFFQKVGMWKMLPEYNLLLSHVAIHIYSLFRGKDLQKPMLNVHGHIHRLPEARGPYKNVSVERTNYTPVHIDELAKLATEYRDVTWEEDREWLHVDPPKESNIV